MTKYPDLVDFVSMINDLRANPTTSIDSYILDVCRKIIVNSKMFKDDEKSQLSLQKFIDTLDI